MECSKCNSINEQDALFCKNCGKSFFSDEAPSKKNRNTFDVLLFISITYWFVMDMVNLLIRNLDGNWYDSPFKYLQIGTNMIYSAIPIFIALSIKKTGLKIPAIIFAAIISIYILYTNIDWLFSGIY